MVFNLLQYPALASQRRIFHSRWTSLSGLVVGSLVALVLMAQVQEKQRHLVQERALLESRLKRVQNQLAADQALQAQQNTWQQQAAHIQSLSAQHRRWEALHLALLQETGPETVQLGRLQLDAHSLELQGQARDVQRMAQARLRLSQALAAPAKDAAWTLISVVNAPAAEGVVPSAPLEFVWQTAWPQVGLGPVASAPAQNPLSAELPKERP